MSETIILINESQRAWSLPGRAVPETEEPKNKGKLDDRGRPRTITSSVVPTLERARMYRPAILDVGARVEVPRWYFDAIRHVPSLKKVWNRKRDGIAVGRTREERVLDADNNRRTEYAEREAELSARASDAERAAREHGSRAAQLEREMEKAQHAEKSQAAEIERLRALLAKRGAPDDAKADDAKADKAKNEEPDPKGRASRNG